MMHPSIEAILRFFEYEHLPKHLQEISRPFASLAHQLLAVDAIRESPHGAEVTTALRKLLEAKDCAVRAALRP